MDTEQEIQESQYHFPYHHLVREGDEKFSQVKNIRWGFIYLPYIQYVLEKIKTRPFNKLLDVGCGDGKFLFEAKKIFPDKVLEGTDYSEQALSFAKAFNPELTFYLGDITNNKFLDKKYDVVSLIEVIEHIPPKSLPDFIIGIHKRLENNGILIITVPSDNTPVSPKHYKHFNIRSLQEILDPHFSITDKYFLNKKGFLKNVIHAMLTNRLFILNQQRTINTLFRFYKRYLLVANEKNSERIFIICTKNENG